MEFSLDEVEDEKPNKPAQKTVDKDAAEEGDLIDQLAAEKAVEGPEEPAPEREETVEEIFAVQQIYALRLKRLEIAPSAAFTLNDPYLKHYGLGLLKAEAPQRTPALPEPAPSTPMMATATPDGTDMAIKKFAEPSTNAPTFSGNPLAVPQEAYRTM